MRINSMGFITDEKIQPRCGTELTGNTLNSLIRFQQDAFSGTL
jgi:hypothetical protein